MAAKRQGANGIDLKVLLTQLAISLGAAGLSAWITQGAFEKYKTLARPPLAPPGVVFPFVWAVMYLLMGASAYLVRTADAYDPSRRNAFWLYYAQLLVNFLWPVFFFRLEWRLFALFWLLALVVLLTMTLYAFRRVRPAAGWLLMPYMLWSYFALYLNLAIVLLNP